MSRTVTVTIVPESSSDTRVPFAVELAYQESTAREGTQVIEQRRRIALDESLRGSAELTGVATDELTVSLLSAAGTTIRSRVVPIREDRVEIRLTKDEIAAASATGEAPTTVPAPIARAGRFLVISGQRSLENYQLVVAEVRTTEAFDRAGLDTLLGLSSPDSAVADVTGQDVTSLSRLVWAASRVGIDGSFATTFTPGRALGWAWWLIGSRQYLGFVPDTLDGARDPLVIPLAFATDEAPAPKPCDCPPGGAMGGSTTIPADVSEVEVVNNPGVYTEDPGAFCRPFSNPERILSEKSFSVIARVTQPEVSARPSRHIRTLDLLHIETDRPILTANATVMARTNIDLLPKVHTLIDRYDTMLGRLPSGRRDVSATSPVQWEDDIAQYQTSGVALGHILDFRVRWRSNGYSLGTVAKTLTLAPRQIKRIQKVEWHRSEWARRDERTRLRDETNDSVIRERDYNDSVAANLEEWARGGSSSSMAAAAGGIGFALPGVIGGFGGGASTAYSTSHQEGGRETTASEVQRLRDSIRRHGDALRKFESTVVAEVSQDEEVTGTTEIIRNYNYAHSLTVIYHQILRHLKVTTEFAGARQCIFIPFAIRPFDVQRAYRWREAIGAAIRSPRYRRALDHLKDVATNFSTSPIVPGPRANQRVRYLRGSIYVNLGVERPKDAADGSFNSAAWGVAQPLLGVPSLGIFSMLSTLVAAQRDAAFQADHAPGMAARWADELVLEGPGGRPIRADFSMASRYQFNRSVRIDFAVPASELAGISRADLTQIRVRAQRDLPAGSVANLTRFSLTYNTASFEHTVEGRTGVNDLVRPITGLRDSADVVLPLDAWESVDEQLEIRRSVETLVEHLNEHVEYYHKAIWWRMDRDRLLMLLDGFYVPGSNGVSIASVVEREPLATIGNALVYRIGAAAFVPVGNIKTPRDLYSLYATNGPIADPMHISLPTDGLYAQTIMDECDALEEHFGNKDWALSDKDPELGAIEASLLASRVGPGTVVQSTTPTPFPGTIINLQNAPDAPPPQGFAGAFGAVTNANAFRDMAGLAGTQANARAALEQAASLATNFGNQAAALEMAKIAKAAQATQDADKKVASIKNAKDKGLTSDAEAAEQTKQVLKAMNPDAAPPAAPHKDPTVNSAIEAAKSIPGSTIEATNPEGTTKVTIGKEDSTKTVIIESKVTAKLRSFGAKSDLSGVTTLAVRPGNMPSGGRLRWSIPPGEAGKYTITQTTTAGGASEVTISGITPGITAIDVEAVDTDGTVLASIKFPLSIPQFITVDDTTADFGTFITTQLLTGVESGMLDETRRVLDAILYPVANVRLVWKSLGHTLPAHIPANRVVTVRLLNTDPDPDTSYAVTFPPSGVTIFNERIDVYPATFFEGGSGDDANATVDALVAAINAIQRSDPEFESWQIRLYGRLLGNTLAHEIGHCLLPDAMNHNQVGGVDAHTGELMDRGKFRSLRERTGIEQISTPSDPTKILESLVDNGIGAMAGFGGANKTFIDTHFPVPPVVPFDK